MAVAGGRLEVAHGEADLLGRWIGCRASGRLLVGWLSVSAALDGCQLHRSALGRDGGGWRLGCSWGRLVWGGSTEGGGGWLARRLGFRFGSIWRLRLSHR
ncbi:hypothetical protein QQ045_020307 [Rhodiola kirilowii]